MNILNKKQALLIFILFFVSVAFSAHAASKEECAAFLKINQNATCDENTPQHLIDNVKEYGFTQDTAAAKDYIHSIAISGGNAPASCRANVDRLNNTFATCGARFLKAFNSSAKGSVVVRNAFRSPDRNDSCGSNAAAGGSPTSMHMKGLAMDVNPRNGASYQDLWQFAIDNPEFGVCFPYLPKYSGRKFLDKPHLALAGISTGEAAKCARQGIKNICSESPTFEPYSGIQQQTYTGDPNMIDPGPNYEEGYEHDAEGDAGNGAYQPPHSTEDPNQATTVGSPYDGQTPGAGSQTGTESIDPNSGYYGDGGQWRSSEFGDAGDSFSGEDGENTMFGSGGDDTLEGGGSGEYGEGDEAYTWGGVNDENTGTRSNNGGGSTEVSPEQNAAIAAQKQEEQEKKQNQDLLYGAFKTSITSEEAKLRIKAFFAKGDTKDVAMAELKRYQDNNANYSGEGGSFGAGGAQGGYEVADTVTYTAPLRNPVRRKSWFSMYDNWNDGSAAQTSEIVGSWFYGDFPPPEELPWWKKIWWGFLGAY